MKTTIAVVTCLSLLPLTVACGGPEELDPDIAEQGQALNPADLYSGYSGGYHSSGSSGYSGGYYSSDSSGYGSGTTGYGCSNISDDVGFGGSSSGTNTYPPGMYCGDGICLLFERQTCIRDCLGYSGYRTCGNGRCDQGETHATCPTDCRKNLCGNGVVNVGEQCDGSLNGKTCKDFRAAGVVPFTGGTLGCSACKYDTKRCSVSQIGSNINVSCYPYGFCIKDNLLGCKTMYGTCWTWPV